MLIIDEVVERLCVVPCGRRRRELDIVWLETTELLRFIKSTTA